LEPVFAAFRASLGLTDYDTGLSGLFHQHFPGASAIAAQRVRLDDGIFMLA
jgi:hypothetical protein